MRLEGLDGVGREVARRVPGAGLLRQPRRRRPRRRRPGRRGNRRRRWTASSSISAGAPSPTLEIPPAAPRHRQAGRPAQLAHQLHAEPVEARRRGGLPVRDDGRRAGARLKLARRAALMHDIGKALTHELDGSHAVIGADYARRLGEAEMVANAIGAHHTDEPFNSPYAYLVAAADAMSGARPGARRQTDDNYVARSRTWSGSPAASRAWPRRSRCRAAARSASTSRRTRRRSGGGRAVDGDRRQDLGGDELPRADPGYRHPRAEGHEVAS